MVTKLIFIVLLTRSSSVLAKIHMVTKHWNYFLHHWEGSVLAKIHMVTKRVCVARL